MTEHKQPWSDDRIFAELSEHSAAYKNDWNAALELTRKLNYAWTADHNALVAKLEAARDEARIADASWTGTLEELKAAEKRVAELIALNERNERNVSDAARINNDSRGTLELAHISVAESVTPEDAWEDVPDCAHWDEDGVASILIVHMPSGKTWVEITSEGGNKASCIWPRNWRLMRRKRESNHWNNTEPTDE